MEFIIDPADNKSYSIYSKNGLELLNEYLQLYKEGGRKVRKVRKVRKNKKTKSKKNKIKKKTKVKKIKTPKAKSPKKSPQKSPQKFIADPDHGKLAKYLKDLSK